MQPESDAQLLRAYAERGAEAAFTELVHRHTNLVYSAAWRQVDSAEAAAEIAQSVFIGLARGAQSLVPRLAADASLAGWLCRSARNLSLNHRRDEFRRQTRERQAMEQIIAIPDAAPDWNHLRRVLDDVMAELDEPDYDALVLRYFQQQDFRAVGVALGVSDDTAQKRVARALEKLRDQLSRRGISTPAAALSIVISANAVQAAPAGLAATISTAALLTGTAVHTSTIIAAIKTIAMTTLQKTLVTVTVAALAGAGIYEARQTAQLREQNQTLQQSQAPLAEQIRQLQRERDVATNRLAGLLAENEQLKSNPHEAELLKLRGEVGVLKQTTSALSNQLSQSSNLYGLLPEQMPPVTSSGVPETAKAYARLVKKLANGQLSTAEEFNLLKAWPYLEKRFPEPDGFAYFQSEYLASLLTITNKDTVWAVRRLLETAREKEHAKGLRWARLSDEELQRYANLNLDIQKIREQWNAINQQTAQQILELLSEDQQPKFSAATLQVLDFDPHLKSSLHAPANDPRFQNLASQEIFDAFFPPNPNVRFVPATVLESK